ncbi:MAG: Mo-dependent nitrogenase C-terminal domain-containing protein [Gomphosphaeria aponina SAG 52.96 = DSM 107014]|uniref:Mo-dependent nitrogenase C-terminal domain-containing protein n=1 Tax=Gomphosphaeria aponina SAG 52.96 = DSM 107014 TaxID=1521640 RepID=A0A941JV80_9CHRO|nr:Mo-dependent nitrogenase C-terminal domain-containing protein [Gomphosphaeria aponina SAG 52.96 = DSM 107014]
MSSIAHSHSHSHDHSLPTPRHRNPNFDIFNPLRRWVDSIEVQNRKLAHVFCQLIPCCCPFERDVNLFGRTLFHIPALCKLNPLYDEFIGLRFRSLSYLADVCGEDITKYIC